MPEVKQWAFSLCAAMTACGIARMLLPRSGMEKVFRMVVSVFFLCCMLSPVLLRNPGLTLETPAESRREIEALSLRLNTLADEQAAELAKENLESVIAGKLLGKGIKVHAVTISINTNGQNASQYLSADIILDRAQEARHTALVGELESELGFTVRLGYRDGEGE